jgi:hypothetical protein
LAIQSIPIAVAHALFDERVRILELDGGLTHSEAEGNRALRQ